MISRRKLLGWLGLAPLAVAMPATREPALGMTIDNFHPAALRYGTLTTRFHGDVLMWNFGEDGRIYPTKVTY